MSTCTIYVAGKAIAEAEYQAWSENLTLTAAALGISVEEAAMLLAQRLAAEIDDEEA